MGIAGLILHILLYVALIGRGLFILRHIKNPIYKGLITGFIAWMIGTWFGIFTTAEMTGYGGITIKALCAGLIESMYRADKSWGRDKKLYSLVQY